MSTMIHHVKIALRQLRRRPIASLVLILTLGLGIGVNSAIFSVVDAVVLRPLPYPAPEELVAVWEGRKGGRSDILFADGNFPDLREQSETLSALAAYSHAPALVSSGETTFRLNVCAATRDFFPLFQVAPVLGRLPAAAEHGEGQPAVAVISHGLWQRVFGEAKDVLGRELLIFGEPTTVVGVMPPSFGFPQDAEVWLDFERYIGDSRTAHNLKLVGRLAPGVTLESARQEMGTIAHNLEDAYPGHLDAAFTIVLRPLHEDLVGGTGTTLILLYCVVGVVLLVACGNIAGILLAWTLSRGRELGVRQALGARSRSLCGQLLAESSLLGLLGSGVGLLLAAWSLSLLNNWVPASFLHSGPIRLDLRLAGFTLVLGLLTGLLCGLAPIWAITRRAPVEFLRTGAHTAATGDGRRWRLGRWVVLPQYALSLAALAVAGLLLKSLLLLVHVHPGFRTQDLVTAEVTVPTSPPSRYADRQVLTEFYRQTLAEVAALPGVEQVTVAHSLPLSGSSINGVALREGQASCSIYPDYRVVGSGYFATLDIQLVAGRDFTEQDRADSVPVAIVGQSLARHLWGDEDPLGKRLKLPGLDFDDEESRRLLTVVGVANDVRHQALDQEPAAAVYVPWTQHLARARSLHVIAAAEGPAERLLEPIRQRLVQQDPTLPEPKVQTLDAWISRATTEPRFRAALLAGFAALAVVLALLGVYGVMSQTLSRRRQEMAIRLAVGARRLDLQSLLLKEAVFFILAGQVLGTLAAVLLSRLLDGLLFGIEATDPGVFAVTSLGLAVVVLVTCYVPSLRAGRINPVTLLNQD